MKINRYPRLDTFLMVEKFFEDTSGEFKKREIWRKLPSKVMYQTFCVIFDYLLESGKIILSRDGFVVWAYNPGLVKKYMNRPDLSWRRITKLKYPMKMVGFLGEEKGVKRVK